MGDSLDMFGDEPEREGEDALETKPTAAELEEAGQGSMFDASPPAASPSDEPEAAPEIAPETVAAGAGISAAGAAGCGSGSGAADGGAAGSGAPNIEACPAASRSAAVG